MSHKYGVLCIRNGSFYKSTLGSRQFNNSKIGLPKINKQQENGPDNEAPRDVVIMKDANALSVNTTKKGKNAPTGLVMLPLRAEKSEDRLLKLIELQCIEWEQDESRGLAQYFGSKKSLKAPTYLTRNMETSFKRPKSRAHKVCRFKLHLLPK